MGLFQVHAPTAKFSGVGHRIGGLIVDARQVQTVDYKTKRPEYWQDKSKSFNPFAPDGTPNDPKAQLEVTVDTGEPDENGETERRLFIKNKRQMDALKAAIRRSGAGRRGLLIGGSLWMTLTGKESTPDGQDANTWEIEYQPPTAGVETRDVDEEVHLFGGGTWRRQPRNSATPAPAPAPASARPAPAAAAATARHGIRDTTVNSSSYDDEPPF